MSKEKTVTLDEPIEVGGIKVSTLTMRRLKVGMMVDAHAQAMADYGVEPTLAMVEPYAFAAACGIPAEEILAMDYGLDYARLQAASRFLTSGGADEAAGMQAKTAAMCDPNEEKPSEISEAAISSGR